MKTSTKLTLAGLSALSLVTANAAPTAAAPVNTGWDDTPQVVVGGGSDTTYLVMQRLTALFNGNPGCAIDTGNTSVNKAKCLATQPASVVTNGNYDHDVFVEATPTGSSAGVNSLLPTGVQYNPPISYARSSRGPSGTETNDLTFWGYGRDALAMLTFGTRSGVALTGAQIAGIYNCTITDWNQINPAFASAPIVPWDMNSASGTFASFQSYYRAQLGNPTAVFGPCVRSLSTGVKPFENDVKPILNDAAFVGADATANTADDDPNNYIWWMSFGNWITYPFTKNGVDVQNANAVINSQMASVDGLTPSANSISNNTYPVLRTIFHVTKNADADCRQAAGTAGVCDNVGANVSGNTLGVGGAVRELTEFLCRTSNAEQAVNPVSGRGYRSEIISAINSEGFQQVPATAGALRTAGYACQVFT